MNIFYAVTASILLALISACESRSTRNECSIEDYKRSEKRIVHDKNTYFSLSIPSSWRAESSRDGDYSEVFIKSNCGLSFMVTARPSSAEERAVSDSKLLDSMLSSSEDHLKSVGNRIINKGRFGGFKGVDKAFVIVSTTSAQDKMLASHGAITDSMVYSVSVISDGSRHSEDLAYSAKETIESLKFR